MWWKDRHRSAVEPRGDIDIHKSTVRSQTTCSCSRNGKEPQWLTIEVAGKQLPTVGEAGERVETSQEHAVRALKGQRA
jgi:hypothetical protein